MLDLTTLFSGKRITQMGLGLLGRGVGDAAWLAKHGAQLLVTDLKRPEELGGSLAQLSSYTNITYRLGEHVVDDFRAGDLILKGAGVPLDSPYINEARSHGIPVDMSASLFARIAQVPLIGVTGTRGKSTVTHLIDAILREDGRETLLGGNVRGVSNLSLFDRVTAGSIGVFELDSWQCQGFGEERSLNAPGVRQGPFSPSLAVFTTFTPDHQNYYKNSMDAYLADKAHIFLHQDAADTFVIGARAYEALQPYKHRIKGHVIIADESDVPNGWSLKLAGVHNRYNVGLAVAATHAFGVDFDVIRRAAEAFSPLPGRLEPAGAVRGIPIYNDTNATTPEATIASLEALDPAHTNRIILIMGGADKGLDLSPLIPAMKQTCKFVVLLPGTGTERLKELCKLQAAYCTEVRDLNEAVAAAHTEAHEGDIILFSPAFASFGLFVNEFDRGDTFMHAVRSLLS